MLAKLLISSSIDKIKDEISKIGIIANHPDTLYFETGSKLGIAEARKIKAHFSLKPYSLKGRVVIIEDISVMTIEAQNALLKTLEEPPEEAILILGTPSEANLLPTILSRLSIYHTPRVIQLHTVDSNIEKLINSSIEDRFEYIEKLKDKKEFLVTLVSYFHQNLPENVEFVKELLQAEQWAKQNVNLRGILEYLMLKMPRI